MKIKGSRPTIGMLISRMDVMFAVPLWKGMAEASKELDFNLIFYAGRPVNSPHEYEAQHNVAYDLIDIEALDGIVLTSASLANYIGKDKFLKFIEPMRSLPIISISMPIEGIPSILTDNKDGMKQAVRHLIEVHNRKRIAFIKGLDANPEAELRYNAYLEVLKEFGIPFDPELVLPGNFHPEAGTEAMRILVKKRKVDFDAVVSSNDDMAVFAFKELQSYGIKIPQEVSMTGFDNIENMKFLSSPFTTVEQPLFIQAKKAGHIIMDMLNGKAVPDKTVLPANLIIRHSCGCLPLTSIMKESDIKMKSTKDSFEIFFQKEKDYIVSHAVDFLVHYKSDSENYKRIFEDFIDAFLMDLKNKDDDHFLRVLNDFLIFYDGNEVIENHWQKILSIFRRLLLFYNNDLGIKSLIEDTIYKAEVLVSEALQRREANKTRAMDQLFWDTHIFIQKINSTTNIDNLLNILSDSIKAIGGIECCRLYLYNRYKSYVKDKKWKLPEYCERVVFYDQKEDGKIKNDNDSEEVVFKTANILRSCFNKKNESRIFLVLPLFTRENHFGFIVYSLSERNELIYEAIRENISNALRGSMLLKELKEKSDELIEARYNAESANKLKSKFLASMSHELRTPMHSINGIADLLNFGTYEKTEEVILELEEAIKSLNVIMKPKNRSKKFLDEINDELLNILDYMNNDKTLKNYVFEELKKKMIHSSEENYEKLMSHIDNIMNHFRNEEIETFEAYRQIKESGNYLLSLVDMVLNLSKIETGDTNVEKTNVNLREFIDSVMLTANSYLKSKDKDSLIKLELFIGINVPEIQLMDKQKTRQVLLNFLSNSIKFSNSGKIGMKITFIGNALKFSVSDEGIGIRNEDNTKIFTEFGRTSDVLEIEGTGLGLAISKKFVELMGGKIGFESKYGKGSLFYFTIPVVGSI